MLDNPQKSRERAEIAFAKTQTQAMARSRIEAERDEFNAARDAKTQRLAELRLQKEAEERAMLMLVPAGKKKRAAAR